MKKKLKNYGLWVAVFAASLLIADALGYKINVGKAQELFDSVLYVFVLLGIVSNPASGKGFTDSEG